MWSRRFHLKPINVSALLLLFVLPASADVFNMPAGQTSLETVLVSDPGNIRDTRYAVPGYGSVDYTYNIGKYEVTAAQYCEFLNSVAKTDTHRLYSSGMSELTYGCGITRTGSGTLAKPYIYSVVPDFADRPVNDVSYWNACRFANWLHNGQPRGTQGPGTTEQGAYALTADAIDNNTVARNANWKWAVTSEDEFYKAAYYNSATVSYFDYPTSSNNINAAMANFGMAVGHTTAVGYGNSSPYGTFDQGGNLYEWNEGIPYWWYRGVRGGSYAAPADYLRASHNDGMATGNETPVVGFRVVEVPEPATLGLFAFSAALFLRRPRLPTAR